MHEMSIAVQIVEIAVASIPGDMAGSAVERVNLKVGKLSAVVPDSLRFCFEIASRETPLSGAVLHIEEIPVKIRCGSCDREWEIDGPVFLCENCGGPADMISGRELDIVSIEVAD